MADITLVIKDRTFNVKKDILCEYSDYFRAMFSGNYVEKDKEAITLNDIDSLDPDTLEIILRYMQIGLIDLSEHSLSTVGDIAQAANFLQITELIKQIEYTLELQISVSNWIEIYLIAEQCNYYKLAKLSIVHGLLSFKNMKSDYIPTIQILVWYLSHPYLDCETESHVFRLGYEWLFKHEIGADALMLLLGCLDFNIISIRDISIIKALVKGYGISLASKVIDCLHYLLEKEQELSTNNIQENKSDICERFTERVYTEVLNVVTNSTSRGICTTPVIPFWVFHGTKPDYAPQYLFTYSKENKFKQWLKVAEKDLWGWSIIAWGPSKIVLVGGEDGRGTGHFMTDVKVYDTFKKEWVCHGVKLPYRRHASLAIVEDSLFIVGGVGAFRVLLDSVVLYDLKERSHRNIAKLPDVIQNPAVCEHEGIVYAASHKNIYKYQDHESKDDWVTILNTEMRMTCMRPFRDYIYCTQSYFSNLYRFKPGVDIKLELITTFSSPPSTMINMRDYLMAITRSMSDLTSVEVYRGKSKNEKPEVLYTEPYTMFRVNEVAGSSAVILEPPPTQWEVSQYLKQYLQRYND